jgi:hypothetical protein
MGKTGKWAKVKPAYNARPSPEMWNERDNVAVMNAAINALDQVARELEQRWGYGTLQRHASPDLAAKFEMANENLRIACEGDDPSLVVQKAENLAKGWRVLEKRAKEKGLKPIDERIWLHIADDGKRYGFVNDIGIAAQVTEEHQCRVYSLDEIVRIIQRYEDEANIVAATKDAFAGAEITSIVKKGEDLNDSIPF